MGNFWGCLSNNNQTPSKGGNHENDVSRQYQLPAARSDETDCICQILPSSELWVFTYAELKAATNNFSDDRFMGRGIFGKVYKGLLDEKGTSKYSSKMLVAIKRLNSNSLQGYEEWQSEVKFLGTLSHPNLLKLLGYCREGKVLFLVYEYVERGSLKNHLFGRCSGVDRISWNVRLKIAMGAAQGLAFLHALEKQIIYRDFRSSYILIDRSYNAKISDFGLAKMSSTNCESYMTTTSGEYGYAAPEYVATGHLSVNSDVYGFGVVLLEILTGLHVVDPKRPIGQENLVNWIKPYLCDGRKLKNIMDPWLEEKYPLKAAFHTAQLALTCIATDPQLRPSMKEVVNTLELIEAIKEKPKKTKIHSICPASKQPNA